MKQSIITAFVISVVGLIPIISESIPGEGLDKVIGTGMLIIGILIIYAIIGAVVAIFKKQRRNRQGNISWDGTHFVDRICCVLVKLLT